MRSSPTAVTARSCAPSPPTCRWWCCTTAGTRPTTPARVVARGAGLSVKRTASPTKIAAALQRVLDDPSFRAGAAGLGAAIRSDAAGTALVDELEDLPEPHPAR